MGKSRTWIIAMILVLYIIAMMLDLIADIRHGYPWINTVAHIFFSVFIIVSTHLLIRRAYKEQKRAEDILHQSREELEGRVNERTVALHKANDLLRTQIEERARIVKEREHLLRQVDTDRAQAEMLAGELSRVNMMLVAVIETLPAGMVIVDADGNIVLANSHARSTFVSSTAENNFGMSEDLILSRTDGTRIGYDDRPLVRAIRNGETTSGMEVEFIRPNQENRYVLIAAAPVTDEGGRVVNAVQIVQDINRLKEMEQALRQSEEKYRTQFDVFSEPTTVWDENGTLLMQNLVSAQNLNGKREDFIGKSILDIFGNEAENYLDRIVRVIETGETDDQEDVVELPVGKRYFSTCIQRILNPDGQMAAQIISYDITDRKLIEEAVRDSEQKFSTIFQFTHNPSGVVRVADSTFLEVNPAFTSSLGYSRSELIGRTWSEIELMTNAEAPAEIQRMLREKGSVMDYELVVYNRSGKPLVWLLSLIPVSIRDESCVLAIGYDITKRKQAEEALKEAQVELERGIKERSILQERQRLARELHDSVSQALYGISLGTHTALVQFDADRGKALEALNYVLSLAQAGLSEMRSLIFELRPESLEQEGLVAALIKQTAALQVRHNIEVVAKSCREPEVSLEVKEAIYRIAQEALQNAVKHSRATRIEVTLCDLTDMLTLEIQDNGVGFDSKSTYPGHFGLHTMQERVTQFNGKLSILSSSGNGTHVTAQIPKIPEVIAEDFAL